MITPSATTNPNINNSNNGYVVSTANVAANMIPTKEITLPYKMVTMLHADV